MKSVLLYSGGIDSFLARYELAKQNIDVELVYCQIATRYGMYERMFLESRKIPITYLSGLYALGSLEQDSAYLPNRNILIASYVAAACDCDTIYIGGTASDRVSDNNQEVMESLSKTLTMSLQRPITITSPFWNKYKTELCSEYVSDGNSAQDLSLNTFSCYTPEDINDDYCVECLNCKACFRKNVALFSVGINKLIKNKVIVKSYMDEFKSCKNSPRKYWTLKYIEYLNAC